MEFSLNTFSLVLFISAIVSAIVAIPAYQRRTVPGATVMFWIAVALTFWSIAYGIENLNPSLDWHKFWTLVQFISIPFIPVFWLIFAIQYTQQNKAPSLVKMAPLFIIPASAVLMAWTNELHHLFWSDMQTVMLSGVSMLTVEFGPYFIFYAIYSYTAIFIGIFFFSRHVIQVEPAYRSQAIIMLAAVIVFISGNGLYLLGLLPFRGLDITPFSFTLSSIILSYGLFRHHLLDLMPIANEMILQNIGDGVLVLDSQKRIIFINPAFEQMAGLLPETSVGSQVDEVLFNWPDIFSKPETAQQIEAKITLGDSQHYLQVQISPIWHRDTLQGSIYVIHDITERASHEEKMRLFIESREKVSEDFIFLALDKTNSIILDVNSSFTMATGYILEEVIGKSVLSLNLISVETRALLNRILLTSPGIYDMTISVRAKNRIEQDWNMSISSLSLNETSFKIWVAQPLKGDIATRPIS
jgi:PAS domain S-box-containing protein